MEIDYNRMFSNCSYFEEFVFNYKEKNYIANFSNELELYKLYSNIVYLFLYHKKSEKTIYIPTQISIPLFNILQIYCNGEVIDDYNLPLYGDGILYKCHPKYPFYRGVYNQLKSLDNIEIILNTLLEIDNEILFHKAVVFEKCDLLFVTVKLFDTSTILSNVQYELSCIKLLQPDIYYKLYLIYNNEFNKILKYCLEHETKYINIEQDLENIETVLGYMAKSILYYPKECNEQYATFLYERNRILKQQIGEIDLNILTHFQTIIHHPNLHHSHSQNQNQTLHLPLVAFEQEEEKEKEKWLEI